MAEKKPDYASLKKGGFMRQKQKGYFSLRLQVVGGNLSAENIRTVSEVADKYGKGYVHMTSRQGIEIPFIRFEDIEEVKEKLAEGGVKPGVCVKACRESALTMEDGKVVIDREKCNHCGRCVKSCPTDAWEGESGYLVSFGGLFGNKIYQGETLLPIIKDKETLFRAADAAIGYFEKNAKPGERFRLMLQRIGEEEFRKVITEAYHG